MFFFFCNDTATTEIYTLSLHDALPICSQRRHDGARHGGGTAGGPRRSGLLPADHRRRGADVRRREDSGRSEEHTSELQSRRDLVCRLLLEKKNKKIGQSSEEIERYISI